MCGLHTAHRKVRALRIAVAMALVFAAAFAAQAADNAMRPADHRAEVGCGADNAAALPALRRRARLAGFYEHFLALENSRVAEWRRGEAARVVLDGGRHVAVAGRHGYAIDDADRLLRWPLGVRGVAPEVEFEQVAFASAGDSGVLAIRCDGSLWQRRADGSVWRRVASRALHAWVGDSSDYYIDGDGRLFASGLAHRGQYGDGLLTAAPAWVAVAARATFVVAHTGHAVMLRDDGAVLGTGGNRFGPLGTHGLGDKADRWGVIFDGASQIASGSRHTLALRADGTLFTWGGADGPAPKVVRASVVAIAAGLDGSTAIDADGAWWHWAVGGAPVRVQWPR